MKIELDGIVELTALTREQQQRVRVDYPATRDGWFLRNQITVRLREASKFGVLGVLDAYCGAEIVRWADASGSMHIGVPENFNTDLASVPFFARWAVERGNPRMVLPAVVHDALYRHSPPTPEINMTGMPPEVTLRVLRRLCDGLFYDLMAAAGVTRWRRWIVMAGVRLGGWMSFRRSEAVFLPAGYFSRTFS